MQMTLSVKCNGSPWNLVGEKQSKGDHHFPRQREVGDATFQMAAAARGDRAGARWAGAVLHN